MTEHTGAPQGAEQQGAPERIVVTGDGQRIELRGAARLPSDTAYVRADRHDEALAALRRQVREFIESHGYLNDCGGETASDSDCLMCAEARVLLRNIGGEI